MTDKPNNVNLDNWEEIQAQGFKWQQNIESWEQHKISLGEWLSGQKEKIGEGNLLVGMPANEQGAPDSSLPNADDTVGIYVRTA